MTKLLEEAFEQAGNLTEPEQDRLAEWLLEELRSENRWGEAFAASSDKLASLADEALAEHRAGNSEPLDPDRL